jgi:hypothetical protein
MRMGCIVQVDGKEMWMVVFTPSSVSGSLAWLVEPSLFVHHLTQAFGKVPRHSKLRGEASFPCAPGFMFCQDCYIHVLYQ